MTRVDDSFHWHAGYELMLLWLLRHDRRDVAVILGLLPDDGTATA